MLAKYFKHYICHHTKHSNKATKHPSSNSDLRGVDSRVHFYSKGFNFLPKFFFSMFVCRRVVLLMILPLLFPLAVNAKQCTGEFVNPITDVCWECLFPITIGSFEIMDGSVAPDTANPSSPFCICQDPVLRVGIIGGFWEPVRLVDVSHEPYCFVNMGGMKMDLGFERGMGARSKATSSKMSSWHVHYYIYPLLYWLELLTDFVCMEEASFDVAYMSELDPTGSDDDLASILSPEAFLFNNLVSQAACSADCLKSSTSLPSDNLHWCSGCQGTMFPLNGNVNAHVGGVQASVNLIQKQLFKMHRAGLAEETASTNSRDICRKRKALKMRKSTYRYQMVNPNPDTCQQLGKTTTTFESKKETPIVGEDFGYLIWRKRNCCIF